MTVSSLGYVVIETSDIEKWRHFAENILGLMKGPITADGCVTFRIDERPFRIAVRAATEDRFVSCGWEFRDSDALDACIRTLQTAGIAVRFGTNVEAAARYAKQIVYCADASGNHLELYVGRAYDHVPFASNHGLSGFVAGEQGLGHVVLPAPQLEATRAFYKTHLGLADTDEMWVDMTGNASDPKLGIYFLHADNRRHHSLALMGAPASSGCVHLMLEARSLDDVGRALDRCISGGAPITSSFGRHSNDFMLSFYVRTPGGFDLEFGCDGLQPDWATWVPTQSLVPDLWGHRWMPSPET